MSAHLRGQERFVWKDGLVVEILPSADDVRKIAPSGRYARSHPEQIVATRARDDARARNA